MARSANPTADIPERHSLEDMAEEDFVEYLASHSRSGDRSLDGDAAEFNRTERGKRASVFADGCPGDPCDNAISHVCSSPRW
jgi:hypothetical protein